VPQAQVSSSAFSVSAHSEMSFTVNHLFVWLECRDGGSTQRKTLPSDINTGHEGANVRVQIDNRIEVPYSTL
jgi:hypothetical protein